MPLLSLSDQKHVSMILDGRKHQTTRKPRKNPVKVGDTLHVYFKSRMKKGTCLNCISKMCVKSNANSNPDNKLEDWEKENNGCQLWYNYFGTAKVTKIEDFDPLLLSPAAIDAWAIADGFESFSEADEWFTRVHGKDWVYQSWSLIFFDGDWLKEA